MANYILKKDGCLYNKGTNHKMKPWSQRVNGKILPNFGWSQYYHLNNINENKFHCLRADPYDMITMYKLEDYNVEVEDGVTTELFAKLHIIFIMNSLIEWYNGSDKDKKSKDRVRHNLFKLLRFNNEIGLMEKDEFLSLWGELYGKEQNILRSDFK